MPVVGLTSEQFARIFGSKDDLDAAPAGRSRKCRTCGGWHRLDKPWPHNCRPPAPPRSRNLASPMIAPAFEAFKAGPMPDDAVIGSRNDKREYMKRNDLCEYETGIRNKNAQWVRERERKNQIAQTISDFWETDPDYWTPEQRGEVTTTENLGTDGQDVDVTAAEGIHE